MTPSLAVDDVLKQAGYVRDGNNDIKLGEDTLPAELRDRVYEILKRNEDPTCILNFWKRLKNNPSNRSVTQLYKFMQHSNIPITPDGTILAYKAVTGDFLDVHSRTIDNSPGTVVKMERNKISDDPNEACHYGLHVGALAYVKNFGGYDSRILIVEVDPANVVSIPYDSNSEKMRVCEYKVVGLYAGALPSTTFSPQTNEFTKVGEDALQVEENEVEEKIGNDTTRVGPKSGSWIKVSREFKKIHAMTFDELLTQPTEDLRRYASNCLKIVGASKIPGGKISLITKIVDVRES